MGTLSNADRLAGMALGSLVCLPMALRAAIKLKVFEIIAAAAAAAAKSLSAAEIVAKIPTTNPAAAVSLDRILRVLAAHSLLTVTYREVDEQRVGFYGLTNETAPLVPGADGFSVAAEYLLCCDAATVTSFYHLEDTVTEGGCVPFRKAHGVPVYEYAGQDKAYRRTFQDAMTNVAPMIMEAVFEAYDGLAQAKEVLDLGGGTGVTAAMILTRYPHLRVVNYDLPFVVAMAPEHPGVVHVAGDMFEQVPKAETIFMKNILHGWNDEECLGLLKNCWEALPEQGKIINVEYVMPQQPGADLVSRLATRIDLLMMTCSPSGKERTVEEFIRLGKAAGFEEVKAFPVVNDIHVIEFNK